MVERERKRKKGRPCNNNEMTKRRTEEAEGGRGRRNNAELVI